MDAAVAALLGAAIGAVGSFGATWLQMRSQHNREMTRMAVDVAMHDYTHMIELAKRMPGAKTVTLPPLSGNVIYHKRILEEVEKGAVTKETLNKINAEFDELTETFKQRPWKEPPTSAVLD